MTHNDNTHMFRVRIDYETPDQQAQQIVSLTHYSRAYTSLAPARSFRTRELARNTAWPRKHPLTGQPLRYEATIQSVPLVWSDTTL